MKPLTQENDFTNVDAIKKGFVIENARFKTRVRVNKDEPVRHCDIVSGTVVCTLINRPGWCSNWRMGVSSRQGPRVLLDAVRWPLRHSVLQTVSLISG